jgi:hypothetical protein
MRMARANICCNEASVVNIVWFFSILLREMKFLDASAKLPKTIIGFFMSVRLSIRTEQIDSHIGGIFAKYDI